MGKKLTILFVCTGNVFRSLSAEYCLKNYLRRNRIKNIKVSSAGTICKKGKHPLVIIKKLGELEIKYYLHKQIKVNKNLLKKYNVIISMAIYHKSFLKKKFNIDSILFNELVTGKKTSVNDIDETSSIEEAQSYMKKTVEYIHHSMPILFDNIKNKK